MLGDDVGGHSSIVVFFHEITKAHVVIAPMHADDLMGVLIDDGGSARSIKRVAGVKIAFFFMSRNKLQYKVVRGIRHGSRANGAVLEGDAWGGNKNSFADADASLFAFWGVKESMRDFKVLLPAVVNEVGSFSFLC